MFDSRQMFAVKFIGQAPCSVVAVTILLEREMTTRRQKRFEARTTSVWAIKPM
ncbi:hypothetical protein OCK02_25685 [Rhizobium sp. TRM96647]|uniref:hypothetical protein n=1 Tax=unclassified Rhizobium TaxID=2613769 RepID=UPI0021E8BC09|nr:MULTISPECIES: hypothetical protein [unclassified Rhizobium]MCV3739524.1 hypothetical protein [Rhizobium sp. TRM96647]MCV3761212.1 hypothetical protein [Rhizobium sp. TRM96650]